MEVVESARQRELERQIQLCVRIAGLGFGPEVMRLALVRKGVSAEAAALIALSVANSHAALRKIEAAAVPGESDRAMMVRDRERYRTSRAAEYFLRRIAALFWFGLVAIGGGMAFGWIVGFEHGAAEGYDWVRHSLERLLWR